MPRVSGKADVDQHLVKLGDAIRAMRLSHGFSQEALADASGVDRSHMGQIERGKRNVSVLNLIRIAAAMGMKPSDVLGSAGL